MGRERRGAKPGERRGGRKKGTKNKSRKMSVDDERLAALVDGGELPVEYMLRIMRSQDVESNRRDDMAKAAASYCHPRLSTIDHGNKDGTALVVKIID